MRLLFDLQPLIQSSRFGITGIARWTLGAIRHLETLAPDWRIEGFVLLNGREGPDRPTFLESGRSLAPLWHGGVWLLSSDDALSVDWDSEPPDAVLGTAFLTPTGGPAEIPVVHDLAFIKYPETLPVSALELLHAHQPAVMERASLTVTVSEAMRREIVEHFGMDLSLVEVVPNGCDYSTAEWSTAPEVELPSEIPPEFFLVVGTLEPRKNIRMILEVHRNIGERRPDFPKLVFAGGKGWREEQFSDALQEQIAAGAVVSLGYVSQSVLDALYRRAVALLFPSLYEGFGLPIIEAMNAGCPVITSNRTGTVEAAGDAGILIDPDDGEAIQQALERVFDHPALRDSLKKLGRARASGFTWLHTAEGLRRAVSKAVALKAGALLP